MTTDVRPEPCPNCGSKNVRWRDRRFYDGILNFFETMLSGATVKRMGDDISPVARSYMDPAFMERQGVEEGRKMMGRRTASRFWRCPDCHQHGEG